MKYTATKAEVKAAELQKLLYQLGLDIFGTIVTAGWRKRNERLYFVINVKINNVSYERYFSHEELSQSDISAREIAVRFISSAATEVTACLLEGKSYENSN